MRNHVTYIQEYEKDNNIKIFILMNPKISSLEYTWGIQTVSLKKKYFRMNG